MSGKRFSPAAFQMQIRTDDADLLPMDVIESGGERDFARLSEDIRTYLAMPRGVTEDERRLYNEQLNRAVLGYTEERGQILAVIADRLLRLRIHELPGYKHPYSSLAEA